MISGVEVPQTGFDALFVPPEEIVRPIQDIEEQALDSYLLMHKVFVGRHGAKFLLGLIPQLQTTQTPEHLVAAGWAATEAGLVLGPQDKELSDGLFDTALNAWQQAISHQRWANLEEEHPLADQGLEYRTAVDIAFLPVFRELAQGQIQKRTLRSVYLDVLNVAQLATVRANLADTAGTQREVGELMGVRHEMNGILAYNRLRSGEWFIVPALSRADSGVYHRDQTHDMVAIHHSKGQIINVVPIEMKSKIKWSQRARYASLIVRGRMHLGYSGRHRPEEVLEALTADFEGTATKAELVHARHASKKMYSMVGDYLRGNPRDHVTARSRPTWFRHLDHVVHRHTGTATKPMR